MTQDSTGKKMVELEAFYLKDAKRVRALTRGFYPERPLSEWRMAAARKLDRGEKLFFIVRNGRDIGGIEETAPFDSATWRIARIQTLEKLAGSDLEEIVRQIIGRNESLYRIDVLASVLTAGQRVPTGHLFDIDWAAGKTTYFAPQVAKQQIAFIPWPFGYLAVRTTADRMKIETIDFVRDGMGGLCSPVKQAAYYHEIIDIEGNLKRSDEVVVENEAEVLKLARRELALYLAGGGHEPAIPFVFPKGTVFQTKVWEQTLAIPYGSVKTYSEIAANIQPDTDKSGQLARAVGQALGANPLPILIPCHRVIGANRDLTGFGGGVDAKAHLLQLEMWQSAPKDPEE